MTQVVRSSKARLIGVFEHPRDYLAARSKAEKIAYLKKISYRDYLRRDAELGDEAVRYFDGATKDFMSMGPDILPALDALSSWYSSLAGLGLEDPGGFRSARDIAAITVNRWPHGYAYVEDSLFDPERAGSPPYAVGRRRCGNVTIANSDAAWNAYTHEAIDQAWRAVNELKSV